jgi:hypothetical protein
MRTLALGVLLSVTAPLLADGTIPESRIILYENGSAKGGITFYYGDIFDGRQLHCSRHLSYDCSETEPWGAFPLEWFEEGRFKCGDRVKITFKSGRTMWVKALDACPGCLHNSIWDSGLPFVADLPSCWRHGEPTATGWIWNASMEKRWLVRQRMM